MLISVSVSVISCSDQSKEKRASISSGSSCFLHIEREGVDVACTLRISSSLANSLRIRHQREEAHQRDQDRGLTHESDSRQPLLLVHSRGVEPLIIVALSLDRFSSASQFLSQEVLIDVNASYWL